jgi:hypothetical protein
MIHQFQFLGFNHALNNFMTSIQHLGIILARGGYKERRPPMKLVVKEATRYGSPLATGHTFGMIQSWIYTL